MPVIKMKQNGEWREVVKGQLSDKPESIIAVDMTSGSKNPNISSDSCNTEYRYLNADGISSLILGTTDVCDENTLIYCSIVFRSGATPTTITNNLRAFFIGDDCEGVNFIPQASTVYEVGLWWNGVNWSASVRGI